ncbi:MAG: hypothetical protein Q4C36_04840 [Coriobacteriia bacterium]|nr:hypothetical protein [Coriobacteriia bacterium]
MAFANVFFNSLIILFAGIACAFLVMNTLFERRHSLVLFFAYFITKMQVVALFDVLAFFGMSGQELQTFSEILIALFGVGSLPVNYYTWDASVVKLGLISIAADFFVGLSMAFSAQFLSWAFGVDVFQYVGYIDLLTFLQPMLSAAAFIAIMQLSKPVFRAIAQHDFRYERAFAIPILASILIGATSRITIGRDEMLWLFAAPLALSACVLPVLLLFMFSEWRRVRRQREYLMRTREIMVACDEELRSQSLFLENSRTMLDGLRKRIEWVGSSSSRGDLQDHLDSLLQACDRLRYGTYSDNPALDVVLMDYERRFSEMGLRAKYRVSPLDSEGERVALAAQALLDWAYRVCARSASASSTRSRELPAAPTVGFRAFRRVNQVFLEAKVSLGGGRVPYMRVSDRLPMAGVVRRWRDGDTLGIRLLLEEVDA